MHRILVEEKRWSGEERFLCAPSYRMLLPGPEAQAAAIALVIEALTRIARRALTNRAAFCIALLSFVATASLAVPFPLIVLGAGLAGFLRARLGLGSFAAPRAGNDGPASQASLPGHRCRSSDAGGAVGRPHSQATRAVAPALLTATALVQLFGLKWNLGRTLTMCAALGAGTLLLR